MRTHSKPPCAIVIGGGPAGLMAAEALSGNSVVVDVYDAMPSLARKFLMAGKGGLNITHAEPASPFLARYGARADRIEPLITAFDPQALRAWVHELGIQTFVGSSGRVFPAQMKAAPLLRAWLHRLRSAGVRFHVRHRWCGWDEQGRVKFLAPTGACVVGYDAAILAVGGASWPELGSDGAWVKALSERGVRVVPLGPANCGFDVAWSDHFRNRFAGHPIKSVSATAVGETGAKVRGEITVTEYGVEGGLIYSLSAELRDQLSANGQASLTLDLAPDRDLSNLTAALAKPRAHRSLANHLRSRANIEGVKAALLHEFLAPEVFAEAARLAARIKALSVPVLRARPIEEAISSAGGVAFESLDEHLMLRAMPGVFCAGEMLDWEAPTGGYLLSACFASGRAAGLGAKSWLMRRFRS